MVKILSVVLLASLLLLSASAQTKTAKGSFTFDYDYAWPACTQTQPKQCTTHFNMYEIASDGSRTLIGTVANPSSNPMTPTKITTQLFELAEGWHTNAVSAVGIMLDGSTIEGEMSNPVTYKIILNPGKPQNLKLT